MAPGPQEKLPPIPKGSKIHKRPLTRPQQTPSSKTRLIYVSSSTPFIGLVKRVRKRLDDAASLTPRPQGRSVHLSARVDALREADGTKGDGRGEVVVLGTGKAIEKTLRVASWFEEERDCDVSLRTRSVGAVDDVVSNQGEGDGFEDESRLRKVSCLEVTIRLR